MPPADETWDPEEVARRSQRFLEELNRPREWLRQPLGGGPYRCPCCHRLTLDERGGFDVCPVCFWEDDGQDDPYAGEVWGGPNKGSLEEARTSYLRIGACHPDLLPHVRPPLPEEL